MYKSYVFDYEPFYIGKGKGNRLLIGLKDVNNSKIKKDIISKIIKVGLEPIVIKLYDNLTEKISFMIEKYFIKTIGRINKNDGPLINKSHGSAKKEIILVDNKIYKNLKTGDIVELYKIINDECYIKYMNKKYKLDFISFAHSFESI